jgi:uncharacterized membrane protein YfcA
MTAELTVVLTLGIALVAFLYSTVGHAGASGYIALMSLLALSPTVIKPTALALNILVACIATWQFWRAGHFSWPLFWPFALLSTPLAFVGGYLNLPTHLFKVLVGIILLLSAARFLLRPTPDAVRAEPRRSVALSVGAGLGLLSGLTGTGGGIFLTPILLSKRWASAKPAAAVSAAFILVNSLAGLVGNLASTRTFPVVAAPLGVAAILGGALGSHLGARRLPHTAIKRLLAIVLIIAGSKLIFTR